MTGKWCILRMAGSRTLGLAKSLNDAGIEAWTPSKVQTIKRPRSTLTVKRDMPIAPTFVFARAEHVRDLLAIAASPMSSHPQFSVFRHGGRIPLISDAGLAGLRGEEDRAKIKSRRAKRRALVMGQRVRISEGAYAGLSGVVEKSKGRWVVVAFDGAVEMTVDSWLLAADDVDHRSADIGAAA